MELTTLALPLILMLALGAWLHHRQSHFAVALGVLVMLLGVGSVVFVLLGEPDDRLARFGGSVLIALPILFAASVALSGRMWARPWTVFLFAPVAYGFGYVVAVNVWMWLGLPH